VFHYHYGRLPDLDILLLMASLWVSAYSVIIFCIAATMPKTQKTPKKPKRERCYLQEAETNVLRELQREWVKLPDKRCRDSFVNATVLPKIQEMNKEKFSPEKISRCKDTKKLWETRVKVSCQSSQNTSGLRTLPGYFWMV